MAGALFGMPDAARAQTLIKLGHDQPESSPHHAAALKWKELVESRSGGRLTVQIFPASVLGSGTQMVEQVQAGALEAAVLPTAWIAPLAPSVSVLDLPFLFPSRQVAYKVIDGPIGGEILAPLAKVNIAGLAFWESGFKQFTGHFPIRTPQDYQGHKIRTMPAPVIQEQFKAFGATPAQISFKELYTALQQKVVDGQENPIATIASMRFYEVQPHMTLSDHGFLAYAFMVNKPLLDGLAEDLRKILADAATEARDYQRTVIVEAEAKNLEIFRKAGVQIIELDAAQRQAFETTSQTVHEWYAKQYGGETLTRIKEAVAAAGSQ
ncbi:MAG: DctP family TRAP transporter solute-binding subunit [Rhizobiales bacterium]|nr:DctP family TRAP transporter solute-binding subunit [Hyphomicrobiales bacterium]